MLFWSYSKESKIVLWYVLLSAISKTSSSSPWFTNWINFSLSVAILCVLVVMCRSMIIFRCFIWLFRRSKYEPPKSKQTWGHYTVCLACEWHDLRQWLSGCHVRLGKICLLIFSCNIHSVVVARKLAFTWKFTLHTTKINKNNKNTWNHHWNLQCLLIDCHE